MKKSGNLSARNSENPTNKVPYFKKNFKKYWKTMKNTGKVWDKSGKLISLEKWEP